MNLSLKNFLGELFELYNNNSIKYCILRNYAYLPDELTASDLDILVFRKHKHKNRKLLLGLIAKFDLVVYHHYYDERFDQYFLYKRTEGAVLFLLKIDFFFDSELYGVKLIDGEQILNNRVAFKNFYICQDVYKVLDKWLYLYLLGAPLPSKYDQEFSVIFERDQELIEKILSGIFNKSKSRELIETICRLGFSGLPIMGGMKRWTALARCAVKSPFYHLLHIPQFFYYRVKWFLKPQGEVISFSGPDGAGKTTILELVLKELKMAFRMSPDNLFHFRPSILPRLAHVAINIHLKKTVDNDYERPHRARASGFIGSVLRALYYLLDYTFGYFVKIRPKLVRRELVVFDRYVYDLIADPGRLRINLPFKLLIFLAGCVRLPDSGFLIYASPQKIGERKKELPEEKIKELNSRYLKILKIRDRFIRINNKSDPVLTAQQVVETVITRRASKVKF